MLLRPTLTSPLLQRNSFSLRQFDHLHAKDGLKLQLRRIPDILESPTVCAQYFFRNVHPTNCSSLELAGQGEAHEFLAHLFCAGILCRSFSAFSKIFVVLICSASQSATLCLRFWRRFYRVGIFVLLCFLFPSISVITQMEGTPLLTARRLRLWTSGMFSRGWY